MVLQDALVLHNNIVYRVTRQVACKIATTDLLCNAVAKMLLKVLLYSLLIEGNLVDFCNIAAVSIYETSIPFLIPDAKQPMTTIDK